MSDALVTQLARALNLPPDAARHTLDHLVATLREQLDTTGQARVPGLGTFHHDEDGLSFHPDDGLARAVNHRYAGLRPIEAGPSSRKPSPEEEPEAESEVEPEPYDPFAEMPSETAEPELPETTVGFQPLESFIEPEEAEDEFEPEPTDSFEQVRPGTSTSEPPAEEPLASEPLAEEDHEVEEEPEVEEEYDIDELLAGTWTEGSETPEDEHVLGALPLDEVEEAEYDLVEPDEADIEPPAAETDWNEEWDEDLAYDEEVEPEDAAEPLPVEPPVAEEPLPEPEAEPELEAEPPAEPRTVAPAVAATARTPVDREPVEPARRRGVPIFLTVIGAVLVIGVVALLWLLNREPGGPDIADRTVPADTAVVAEAPPAGTLAAVPPDTAAVAEAPPEPEEPAASADPLRSTAGIDPAAGGFTWVVASELDRAAAERRVARYREQGLRADVVADEAGGRTRYRVSLGQFGSIAEAEALRADLPADVPSDSWILQL